MKRWNILVAEGDEALRRSIRIAMRSFGYGVCCVENDGQALDLILALENTADAVDLIIIGMRMYDLTALTLLDALNKRDRIPTIAIVSYEDKYTLEDLRRRGRCDCIEKPFLPHELAECVRRTLETHSIALRAGEGGALCGVTPPPECVAVCCPHIAHGGKEAAV